ncbi:class A beta-lactamase [Acidovorax sp. NCPPB 4044]|uniref:class A beta-lactamase n=1 Tax=Acidovorax sp. NCPPB 4044 TaxID=2940490 RepID=UPI0023032648|nr:class A beta-lactamase [Acidovorax sp. NCPPB 4044]MDA8521141.1 class A beta-lactamase [Acidovorax sp. NCPPB 4044]
MQRRTLMGWAAAAAAGLGVSSIHAQGKKILAPDAAGLQEALQRIEAAVGGRLGVGLLDVEAGRHAAYRGDELFPLCSTFKLLLAAQVLRRVDQGQEQLDRRVTYRKADLVEYSPATAPHADGEGMTVGQLCEAAVTLSDNTAANLLLDSQGGPQGLTAWLRSLGDAHTRLDRKEPELNDVPEGEVRDTTTPRAMARTVWAITHGEALSAAGRGQIIDWLVGNRTGDKRLRAGMPQGWRIGEKTGTGPRGTSNDAGLFWPPGRKPVMVSCYLTGSPAEPARRDEAIAQVGVLAARWALAASGAR